MAETAGRGYRGRMDRPLIQALVSIMNLSQAVRERDDQHQAAAALSDARAGLPPESSKPAESSPRSADDRAWWTLLCGEKLDLGSAGSREQVRAELRKTAAAHGLSPEELTWVWDASGLAQLKVGEFADQQSAESFARELRKRGLKVRVRMERG